MLLSFCNISHELLKKLTKDIDKRLLKSKSKEFHGVYRAGVHLFPSRTEKLSPAPPMVLSSNSGE